MRGVVTKLLVWGALVAWAPGAAAGGDDDWELTTADRTSLAWMAQALPQHALPALETPALGADHRAWRTLAERLVALWVRPEGLRKAVLGARPLAPALAEHVPSHRRYRGLQQVWAKLRANPERLEGLRLAKTPYALREGVRSTAVSVLRERLRWAGFDPGPASAKRAPMFDADVARALSKWQRFQGLERTAWVDRKTFKRLNRRLAEWPRDVALALRRWQRLELRQDTGKQVLVHLNTFMLDAEQDGTTELQMVVVIGRATANDATPALSTVMEEVIVNPWWFVPPRIVRDSLLPSVGGNPVGLKERGYRVRERGGVVQVARPPGPSNPIGQVKFALNDSDGIFLHDSPDTARFAEPVRLFSHGCVRLDKAFDLARWAVADSQREQLRKALALDGGKWVSVGLRPGEPVAVHLVYQTLTAGPDGTVTRHADVYQRDAVQRALWAPAAEVQAALLAPDPGPVPPAPLEAPHGPRDHRPEPLR